MLTGFRVIWRALVHFWDESLLLIKANLAWGVASLPLYLLTVFVCALFIPSVNPESGENIWPWVMSAFILVTIPGPSSAGVYAIANHIVNDETPELSMFWRAVKLLWKKALIIYLIGAAVFGGLIFNTAFYMQVSTGLLQAVAILWLYAIIYWLSMQAYLLPMLVQAAIPPPPQLSGDDGWPIDESRPARTPPPTPEPEFLPLTTLYKRAAILALANPLMSLVMLFSVLVALAISSVALPVYPLLVMSLAALINCRGLRALREKYSPAEAQGAAGVTVGSRILGGRYRLGSVLGQGGMAVVYRAEDLTLGRTVAVKILRESLGTDPEFLERFRREARAAARLNHPNIVAVYDVGQDGLSNYFVMEYVEGTDLRDLIRDDGPLPPERIVDLGCQIAAALEYAHRSGLVHRDIKSQNVLVTPDGKVKVADFGIAIMHGEGSITQAGMVIGSVHYMSPEQAEGRPTTAASDVYSLGVVLYEMATGQLPFTAESPVAIARLQLEATPRPPHLVNPRLPLPVSEVILACLEKRPAHRPSSAAMVAATLRGQRVVASSQTAALPIGDRADGTRLVPGPGTEGQRTDGTRRRPANPIPDATAAPPDPIAQTDFLMPNDRRLARRPARPPGRPDGGSRIWPLFWITVLLATIGAAGGWMLAGAPGKAPNPTATPGPVLVMTPQSPPTSAPVATKPAVQPTAPPATPVPSPPPAKPTTPPQPTATAVPPTSVPQPTATPPPPKPTVPSGMSPVPNVINRTEAEASKAIQDTGLTVKVEERRGPGVREGIVVDQNPKSGQALAGSTVTIVVGRAGGQPKPAPKPGMVLVPNVEGMDEKEAVKTLQDQGFNPDVRRESSRDHKGQVIDQNPGKDDTVRPGSTVRITIGT